jgi:hypothetical protein
LSRYVKPLIRPGSSSVPYREPSIGLSHSDINPSVSLFLNNHQSTGPVAELSVNSQRTALVAFGMFCMLSSVLQSYRAVYPHNQTDTPLQVLAHPAVVHQTTDFLRPAENLIMEKVDLPKDVYRCMKGAY